MGRGIGYFAERIVQWLQMYFENDSGLFLLLAIIAFVYLFITQKKLRYKFLLPIVLMMAIVLNPIIYKYVFSELAYWRLFWIFPGTLLIAIAAVMLIKQVKRTWIKVVALCVVMAVIFLGGNNVFEKGGFSPRSNWEKISEETIAVSNIMLATDENPRAIIQTEIYIEVRQYAPQIKMLYGRETLLAGSRYIRDPEPEALAIYNAMIASPVQYKYVLDFACEEDYNFIVVSVKTPFPEEVLIRYGFSEVGRTENHIIYYKDK